MSTWTAYMVILNINKTNKDSAICTVWCLFVTSMCMNRQPQLKPFSLKCFKLIPQADFVRLVQCAYQ